MFGGSCFSSFNISDKHYISLHVQVSLGVPFLPDSQTKVAIILLSKDTRKKNQLHLQSVILYSIQNGVFYSSVRIFDKLPSYIVQLHENTMAFRNILKKFS
jgi:hypothetical protein